MKKSSLSSAKSQATTANKKIKEKILLSNKQIPGVMFMGFISLNSGEIIPAQTYENEHTVYFVQAGGGIIKIDGQVDTIQSGDLLVVDPNESHELLNNTREALDLLYLRLKK